MKFIIWRVGTAIPLLLALSVLIFLMLQLMPGSVAVTLLGDAATPENILALEEELGLNDPLPIQYLRWVTQALQGDFGRSVSNGRPVGETILEKLPITLTLAAGGLVVMVCVGLSIGILAGLRPGSPVDRSATIVASIGEAMPPFWLALLLLVFFAVQLRWFPAIGYTPWRKDPVAWLHGLFLPWLALGLPASSLLIRQTRTAFSQVWQADYIRAARATGVEGWRLIARHALPNALIPVITIIGLRIPVLFGSAFVVEQVFAFPGLGTLMVGAVLSQDIPVVQGVVLYTAVVIVVTNFLVDLSYKWLNPKIELG